MARLSLNLRTQDLRQPQSLIIAFLLFCPLLNAQHSAGQSSLQAAAELKKLELAPGLSVSLFAAEPLLENPVSFSIDHDGRFYIAETHRWDSAVFDITKQTNWLQADLSFRTVQDRHTFLTNAFAANPGILTHASDQVRLVEDRNGDGRADHSSIFATGFNHPTTGPAAGVLAWNREIWFACVPELVHLKNSGASDQASERRVLAEGFGVHIGVSGHDLHGLTMGPDGRIYFSMGDRGVSLTTREGKSIQLPDTGAVFRCDPDGSNLEVFAIGLRNPQELAFDNEGNLWTNDNDTAGADPSRVLHIVEGGDYGWRCSYQHMAGFGPWVLENNWKGEQDGILPIAGIVAQGPSGLAFHPGSGAMAGQRNSFYVCDFPGGVWRFEVTPSGATYKVSKSEKAVWNLWPTDVDFGPDGALYISDWVAGWTQPGKGRVLRITPRDGFDEQSATETRALLGSAIEDLTPNRLSELLAHPDRRIRLRAQFALARRGPDGTRAFTSTLADGKGHSMARRHALWGLAQQGRRDESVISTLKGVLEDPDPELRRLAAETAGNLQFFSLDSNLSRLLQDPSPRVQFHAILALGKLGQRGTFSKLVRFAERQKSIDPFLQHALVFSIQRLDDQDRTLELAKHKIPFVRRIALLALRRGERPEIALFLKDRDQGLLIEAARAIHDVPIPAATTALAEKLDDANAPQALLSRSIEANYRLGTEPSANRLAAFAARAEASVESRGLALTRLAAWEKPSPIDGIMGLWRPLPNRDPGPASKVLLRNLESLLTSGTNGPLLQTVAAMTALKLDHPRVVDIARSAANSSQVRLAALSHLAAVRSPKLSQALADALATKNIDLRKGALELLGSAGITNAAGMLTRLLDEETDIGIRQTVFKSLAQQPADEQLTSTLSQWMDRLVNEKPVPLALHLEIIEAAGRQTNVQLTSRLEEYGRRVSGGPLTRYRPALAGGNVEEGRKVFHELAGVECARCHAVRGTGGSVGPDLSKIGGQRTREELLESVLYPNARISPGFDNILLTLKNGNSHAGLVKSESDTELVLQSPEDGLLRLKTADIASRSRSMSAMPEEVGRTLSLRQLRDLLEYLASLR